MKNSRKVRALVPGGERVWANTARFARVGSMYRRSSQPPRRKALLALLLLLLLAAGALLLFLLFPRGDKSEPSLSSRATHAAPHRQPSPENIDDARGSDPDLAIRGIVVDLAGKPIPQARLELARASSHDADPLGAERCECGCPICLRRALLDCTCNAALTQLAALVETRQAEWSAERVAQGGDDGLFTFVRLGARAERYTLAASAPGYATAVRYGVVPASSHALDEGTLVRLALEPSWPLRGRAVDERGAAIAGALITALPTLLPKYLETITGPDGTFRLDGLGSGGAVLIASAERKLPATARFANHPGEPLLLTLRSPRTLIGTVLDRGAPLQGAQVRLQQGHLSRAVESARGGTFRFEQLAPGEVSVSASAKGRFAATKVTLDAEETRVALHLGAAEEISGVVTDEDGAPLPATVRALLGRAAVASTQCDGEGRFTFDALAPGTALEASHPGYASTRAALLSRGAPVTLVLRGEVAVSGVVVDARGTPLPEIQVSLAGEERESDKSDREGRFRLVVEQAGPVTLMSHHSHYGSAELEVTAPAEGVVLKVAHGAVISLRALDEAGAPVAGATAAAIPKKSYTILSSDLPSGLDGRLRMAGLATGRYDLFLQAEGFITVERSDLTLSADDQLLELGDVRLSRGLTLAGHVLLASGEPASGARLMAMLAPDTDNTSPTHGEGTAGPDGRFSLGGLKPGTYELLALHDLGAARATAQAGTTDLLLRFDPLVKLRGRVFGHDGLPLRQFTLNRREFESPDGRFEIEATPRGEYAEYRLWAPGHSARRGVVRIDNGVADAGDLLLRAEGKGGEQAPEERTAP